MKCKLLFSLPLFFSLKNACSQDSIYYSILWKPTTIYKNAGVTEETVYEYKTDSVTSDSLLLQIKEYNGLGQVTRQTDFRWGVVSAETSNIYSGLLLDSATEVRTTPRQTILSRYDYDSAGRLQREKTGEGVATTWTRYVYNSNGQPAEVYKKDKGEKEQLYSKYTYRPDGRINRIDYFRNREKRPLMAYIYEYDFKDNEQAVKRLLWIASPGETSLDCKRTYNNKWQLIKTETPNRMVVENTAERFSMRTWTEEETVDYLPNGLVKEKKVYRNGQLYKTEKHFYL